MHRNVEHHPATGGLVCEPPALQVNRQIHRVVHPRRHQAAQRPGPHHIAHLAVGAVVAQVVVGAQHHAGAAASGHHAPGGVQAGGQGFLAEHMPALRSGVQGLRFVLLVGRRDVDRVHAQATEAGFGVERMGNAVLAGKVAGTGQVARDHRHHLVAHRPDGSHHPLASDGAGPDQCPTQRAVTCWHAGS